jgi:hypothetical protein
MKIRKLGLFLALGLLVACPIAIDLWTSYAYAHFPPKQSFDRGNDWTRVPINYLTFLDILCAICVVLCARGWKWRLGFTVLGLIVLLFCLFQGFGAWMQLTNSWL